jgi:hypothetical protein
VATAARRISVSCLPAARSPPGRWAGDEDPPAGQPVAHRAQHKVGSMAGAARTGTARHERPSDLGTLEISATPPPQVALDDATLAAYADLGVTRLIAIPPREGRHDADTQVRFLDDLGARIDHHPALSRPQPSVVAAG